MNYRYLAVIREYLRVNGEGFEPVVVLLYSYELADTRGGPLGWWSLGYFALPLVQLAVGCVAALLW